MKNRILLSLAVGVTVLSLLSNSQGITGNSTSGCSCHGTPSTNSQVTILGDPLTNGYEPGVTYTMTTGILNTNGKLAAGFDLGVTDGTLIAGANNQLVNGELTHVSPQALTNGAVAFIYEWTAPSAGAGDVTFNVAINAVNGDGSTDGDEYNVYTATAKEITAPDQVENLVEQDITLFPVPADDFLHVKYDADIEDLQIFSVLGQEMRTHSQKETDGYKLDISELSSGGYVLVYKIAGIAHVKSFTKK